MKKIAIVTEGDSQMGLGHIVRNLALGEKLRAEGTVVFVTHSPPEVQHKIKTQGFHVMTDINYEVSLERYAPDVVVIDKLQVEEKLAKYIRYDLGCKLAIIGNVSPANQHAHLVVNAVVGAGLENVKRLDKATGTIYLEGPAYIVLRDEFYQRRGSYEYHPELSNVLLIFGGADPNNLTCATLDKLLDDESIKKITICLGVMYQHEDKIRNILSSRPVKEKVVSILHDVDNVAQILSENDIVLTSLGITLFEAFSMEIPALAFFQNVLQQTMTKNFPMTYDYERIADLCAFVRQKHRAYTDYLNLIRPLQSGAGANEIVDIIVGSSATERR